VANGGTVLDAADAGLYGRGVFTGITAVDDRIVLDAVTSLRGRGVFTDVTALLAMDALIVLHVTAGLNGRCVPVGVATLVTADDVIGLHVAAAVYWQGAFTDIAALVQVEDLTLFHVAAAVSRKGVSVVIAAIDVRFGLDDGAAILVCIWDVFCVTAATVANALRHVDEGVRLVSRLKTSLSSLTLRNAKLECLSLITLFSLVCNLCVRHAGCL